MLIDSFADDRLEVLQQRSRALSPGHHLHLLIDGAFVPGLHRRIGTDRKALLFDGLPGSTAQTLDLSPFVVPCNPDARAITSMLRTCRGWPMVSVIETPESWTAFAVRLAAWCVIESDGQRFNFRFADTRRLPAILKTLDPVQRAQFAGPAVSWSCIGRDGSWQTLALDGAGKEVTVDPRLDEAQFGKLVDDGRVDEVLARLAWPDRMAYKPSQAHALISSALPPAVQAGLGDSELVDWCGWLWARSGQDAVFDIAALFAAWKSQIFSDGDSDAAET